MNYNTSSNNEDDRSCLFLPACTKNKRFHSDYTITAAMLDRRMELVQAQLDKLNERIIYLEGLENIRSKYPEPSATTNHSTN